MAKLTKTQKKKLALDAMRKIDKLYIANEISATEIVQFGKLFTKVIRRIDPNFMRK